MLLPFLRKTGGCIGNGSDRLNVSECELWHGEDERLTCYGAFSISRVGLVVCVWYKHATVSQFIWEESHEFAIASREEYTQC